MLKVLELFAGIGATSKALERLGIEHEIVDAVEIDKYAITSFNAIHGTNFEPQDITTWDKDIEVDLIMHGSPCQDFSVAGKQAGGDVGSGTRSSLMYETVRIVGKLRPKYVVWENVKNLLSKKHKHNFDAYIETINILGYNSYYQVLNAKDYGIPQNRERVFTISIRKDIDDGSFKFPEKEPLLLRLKDMLEDEVDEKYYLNNVQIDKIKASNFCVNQRRIQEKDYCDTLCARDWKDPKCVQIEELHTNVLGTLEMDKWQDHMKRIYDVNTYAPTLGTMQGGNTEPKILEEPQLITHTIQQTVKVRKYLVDVENLKKVLRNAKLEQDLNNKEISEILDIPQTQVEHYFRTDSSFAIPSPDIWYKLKEILKIETDEFDESIMTFEEKEGIYEKANRIYDEQGLAPTLTQQEEKILVKNATKQGYIEAEEGDSINISFPTSNTRRGRVGKGVAQTLQCNDLMAVVENINKNAKHQQDFVQSENNICRCIPAGTHGSTPHLLKTIVTEPKVDVIGNYMPSGHDASRIVDSEGLAPTVKENHGTVTATNCNLRIRKLTPKECWRLMGFDDEDFEKAKAVPMSNTQLYKQAGNSIVVNVLEKIFKNLLGGK